MKAEKRETVELVDGRVYWSDDNWQTVWKAALGGLGDGRIVTSKLEANQIKFVALHKYGGGRDD